jgi:LysM repeat protein
MSACVVLVWCILPLAAVVGFRVPGLAQANISSAANISTASSTSTRMILTSESVTAKTAKTAKTANVTARPAERAATWTVQPGDTLSAIAAALRVPGGWQALYAANRRAVGSDPNLIRPGTLLALPGTSGSARYTVAPGDTLSAIAAALGVPGGWQALYAANRRAVGPNPNAISPGIILATPRQATQGQASGAPAPTQAQPRRQAPPVKANPTHANPTHANPTHAKPTEAPPVQARSSHLTAPVTGTTGGMPRWLVDVLLAAGVLAATAFAAEPAAALVRRRKATASGRPTGPVPAARPARSFSAARHRASGRTRDLAKQAAEKAKIILADHERLIVTYSIRDHTVYVLTPPGEDPVAVLSAARLVLPEDTYNDLAGRLGVPSAWPPE